MVTIGVLALQGGVEEHLTALEQIPGVKGLKVKKKEDFKGLDGLILPGGESTTLSKLINIFQLKEEIIALATEEKPIWGTCAGMILLAKNIIGEESHLNLMDITVQRNGYGNQLSSFKGKALIPKVASKEIPLTFIRAPYITKASSQMEILLKLEGKIVAVEDNNLLATSFHPELDQDLNFHKYFVSKINKAG